MSELAGHNLATLRHARVVVLVKVAQSYFFIHYFVIILSPLSCCVVAYWLGLRGLGLILKLKAEVCFCNTN